MAKNIVIDDSPVDVSTEVTLFGRLLINYVVLIRVINIKMSLFL